MRVALWIALSYAILCGACGVVVKRVRGDGKLRLGEPAGSFTHDVSRQNCVESALDELSRDTPIDELPSSLSEVRTPLQAFRAEGTTCANGSPHAFALVKNDPQKLLIYLLPGGACFDYETCCGEDQPYESEVDLRTLALASCLPSIELELYDLGGLLSSAPENPARDFSVLIVFYCSGDVALANITATYANTDGATCEIEHRGASNAKIAVDWALGIFSNELNSLTDLIIAGDSAGGYTSTYMAPYVLDSLSRSQADTVKATVVIGGAVGIATFPESWGLTTSGLPPLVFAPDEGFPDATGFIPRNGGITEPGLDTGPTARGGREFSDGVYKYFEDNMQVIELSFAQDSIQIFYAELSAKRLGANNVCGGGPCNSERFESFQQMLFEGSASARANYAGVLIDGTDHVVAIAQNLFELDGAVHQGSSSETLAVSAVLRQAINRQGVAPVTDFHAASPSVTASLSESPTPSDSGSPNASVSPSADPSGPPNASGSPAQTPTPTPEPSPTPFPTGPVADTVCFPADAEVETACGTVRMDELAVGDRVRVGAEQWSEVFMFTHQHREVVTEMVRLEAGGRRVELSGTHYLQIGKELRAARAVEVGDTIELGNGTMIAVTGVRTVRKRGLYNPQTLDGDIVVNGIRASTFTETVEPRLARMLLVVPKALYRLGIWNPFGRMFRGDNRLAAKLVPRGATKQVIA